MRVRTIDDRIIFSLLGRFPVRLSEIQNGFARPKALFSQVCLFMQFLIFSKFTRPDKILQHMSFGPVDFVKSE